jgi:toxin ParE1/3/4
VPTKVFVRLAADRDLRSIYRHIAKSSPANARRFVGAIEDRLAKFADVPIIGADRGDLLPGCRTVGFRRRVTIMFRVTEGRVDILRVLYGGRDIERAAPKR